ncbi:hypothetical protein FGRMN_7252 [Fusarium graminum]|nr:hypothetical protein FGRMN_7252 [Fusarium graminum]
MSGIPPGWNPRALAVLGVASWDELERRLPAALALREEIEGKLLEEQLEIIRIRSLPKSEQPKSAESQKTQVAEEKEIDAEFKFIKSEKKENETEKAVADQEFQDPKGTAKDGVNGQQANSKGKDKFFV